MSQGNIDYASISTSQGKSGSMGMPLVITLLALTAVALFTCLRIEILNAQDGYYLPRKDFAEETNNDWRYSTMTSEARWRRSQADRTGDGMLLTRPLTPTEAADMNSTISGSRLRNALYDAVEFSGVIQHPLTFGLLLTIPFCFQRERRRKMRTILAVAFVCSLGCAIMMFYRGYFTSLGIFG